MKFEDNPEFVVALKLANSTCSFFLSGKAGTGKSTFIRHLIGTLEKSVVVLALTGVAALNVEGQTIHSFFKLPRRVLMPEDIEIKKNLYNYPEKRKIISSLDTLIIDEVSMVRADLMDAIDYSLRIHGGNPIYHLAVNKLFL